jgi:subtilisin family serine protease
MKTTRLFSTLVVITALLLSFVSSPASADTFTTDASIFRSRNTNPNLDKIDSSILDALSAGDPLEDVGFVRSATADFFVWLSDQADLSPATRLATKTDKGQYVYATLRSTAERSQPSLLAFLDQQGAAYRSFYIINAILVRRGDLSLALSLAARPDVARITSNPRIQILQPFLHPIGPKSPAEIEPNITFINADDVWALGITGQDTVLAVIDTGIQWDHPAIIDHYRGWDGSLADHNYSWWDATGNYPNEPFDGNGHGTMVTGVMVGGEGAENQIGVAPGAKTIHCKAIGDGGSGLTGDFLECFQWILAPWDLSGANPDPDLAPDAVTNAWGIQGGFPGLEAAIDTLQMAGILVEASAGGSGPNCFTLASPGDYAQVLTTGVVDQTGGVLPGTLAWFSGRGSSLDDPLAYIPDVLAPSINIRSSYPGDDYDVWSGTAVAGAHATGLVGLIWSANPLLRGNIIDTSQIIYDSAVPLTGQPGSGCGGDYITGPNNDWGYGTP